MTKEISKSARSYANYFIQERVAEYKDQLQWNVLKDTEHDFLYEWFVVKGRDDYVTTEHELVRVIRTEDGVYAMTFNQKGLVELDEAIRSKWLKIIESAQVPETFPVAKGYSK